MAAEHLPRRLPVALGVAALALAALWRLTPLATWLDPAALERISGWIRGIVGLDVD